MRTTQAATGLLLKQFSDDEVIDSLVSEWMMLINTSHSRVFPCVRLENVACVYTKLDEKKRKNSSNEVPTKLSLHECTKKAKKYINVGIISILVIRHSNFIALTIYYDCLQAHSNNMHTSLRNPHAYFLRNGDRM